MSEAGTREIIKEYSKKNAFITLLIILKDYTMWQKMKCEEHKYDDIQAGEECSFSKILTRETIEEFIKITGDMHPLHTNMEYSRKSGFKDIIAHGMLTSAFASTVVGMYLPGLHAILLSQSFKYIKPVYPGEILNITGKVKRKVDALSVIVIEVEIKNSADEVVSRGDMQVKVRA